MKWIWERPVQRVFIIIFLSSPLASLDLILSRSSPCSSSSIPWSSHLSSPGCLIPAHHTAVDCDVSVYPRRVPSFSPAPRAVPALYLLPLIGNLAGGTGWGGTQHQHHHQPKNQQKKKRIVIFSSASGIIGNGSFGWSSFSSFSFFPSSAFSLSLSPHLLSPFRFSWGEERLKHHL